MVVGLDHESSDASEGPGAVCLLSPSKQGWRDHHSGIYRNRTHERARVQLFKAIPVVGHFTPELEKPTKGLERRFARSVSGDKSCVELRETKVVQCNFITGGLEVSCRKPLCQVTPNPCISRGPQATCVAGGASTTPPSCR